MEAVKTNRFNPPANQPQQEAKLHFLDYWRIIRIRKTVILAVFLLVVLSTTAVTFLLSETYMSTATIEVNKEGSDISPLLQIAPMSQQYDPYFIETEFQKIRSANVLNPVIRDLHLVSVWSKRFNTTLSENDAYEMLKKMLDLRQARNTSLIEIRAFSGDKKEAMDIANAIATTYQQNRRDVRLKIAESGIQALQSQFDEQTKLVKQAQDKVDQLRLTNNISDMGDSSFQTTSEPEIVRNLERDKTQYALNYIQAKTLVEKLGGLDKKELRKTIPTAAPDPALDKALASLNEAELRLTALSSDFAPGHPDVVKAEALVTTLNRQIDDRIDGIMQGLTSLVASKKAAVDAMDLKVEQAKKTDAEQRMKYGPYFAAKRDLETQQRIRETVYMRILQETVDSKMPRSTMVEIVEPAKIEDKPVRPSVSLNITLGVIVGLLMGFGLAFFIEYLDTSVKTIDDVERALQAPVLGVIPQNVGSLISEGVDSPHAEAYRVLRTNLLFSRKESGLSTITVVSGGAGEGKSTTIFNLAIVFAQNGSRVLLVDSDLRRPSLHKIMNVSNSLGLTNFLLKQNTIEEVIQTTSLPNLHFLASGKLPSSSLGILNSAQMRDFIQKAKERYDFVFFDSPPIMGVSDASILASEVDMSLLVIQYRKYPQVMTIRAKQMVEKVGGNLLGVVLNNINISQDSYYYYYSGYYYDYYSKHDDSDGKPDKKSDKKTAKNGEAKKSEVASADRGTSLDIKPKY